MPRHPPAAAAATLLVPGDALDLIAALLPQADRLNLAATCPALRRASQRWFTEVDARLQEPDTAAAESLAAWLRRHSNCHACIAFCVADGGDDTIDAGGSAALRALRGAAVTSLICGFNYAYTARDVPAAALAGWDALTRLEFSHACLSGSLRHVCQLGQLRHLVLDGREISGGWRQLAALARLQHLDLAECHAQQVVDSLTALEALTHLALSGFEQRASSWQNLARLTRLRYLSLAADTVREAPQHLRCLQLLEHLRLMPDLPEVPHHLSVLTSLTCLNLSDNEELAGGWQHVLPLMRLRRLVLTLSGVELIPREFSEMTGLTALLLNHACVGRV